MTTRSFQWGMRIMSLLGLGAVFFLLIASSPYQNSDPGQRIALNIVLFYASLFFALWGIFSLFLFWLRRKATGVDLLKTHMGVSLRQGLLLALCTIGLLILQSFRILTWWDGALTMGGVMMVELYFLAR